MVVQRAGFKNLRTLIRAAPRNSPSSTASHPRTQPFPPASQNQPQDYPLQGCRAACVGSGPAYQQVSSHCRQQLSQPTRLKASPACLHTNSSQPWHNRRAHAVHIVSTPNTYRSGERGECATRLHLRRKATSPGSGHITDLFNTYRQVRG